MTEYNETRNPILEQLENLITVYGKEKVMHFASKLLDAKKRDLGSEYLPILTLKAITQSLDQLDICAKDVSAKSETKEALYQNKGSLLKKKFQLETAVKLKEANAFMEIEGFGKDQYAIVGERRITLSNDTMRDAYRRKASEAERQELAAVNGDIATLESQLQQANDALYTAKDALESARSKAGLQASLLTFLAGR